MNILLVMSDSLAPHFCSAYGDAAQAMPNLERLASRSVVFENAYCNSPLCAPSRASMVTGRYVSEITCFDNASEFSTEWPTIGHVLGGQGYETAIIGKMHFVGHDQWHGFDHRIAHDTDYTRGHDPRLYNIAYSWEQPSGGNPVGHNWMGPSYAWKPEWEDYPLHYNWDEQIHRAALAYLSEKDASAAPFWCCVSYHAPHNPFWMPQGDRARFRGRALSLPHVPEGIETCHGPMDSWLNDFHYLPEIADRLMQEDNLRWLYETFYSILYDLDRRIGELLALVKSRGLSANTAILFASDHGDMMAHRGMVQKRYFYERSVRVPLMFSFPGSWRQGVRLSTPVSLVDLLPTLAELAGAPTPNDLPGVSLVPSLATGDEPPPRTLFCEYHGEGVHAPCFMALEGSMKYVYVHGHEERLYDVAADPDEYQNLIGHESHSGLASKMKEKLLDRFDPEQVAQAAILSQRRRGFIHARVQQAASQLDDHPADGERDAPIAESTRK